MSNSTLYDDDILLWSEQQAAIIRKLGQTRRDLPNELDIENVAEEVESVGRSEFAAVKSYIRLILLHLIKLLVDPDQEAAKHWRDEILAFHADMTDRYAPSMQQRIDIDELWKQARERCMLAYEGAPHQLVEQLPSDCPLMLGDLLAERLDSGFLIARLRQAVVTK
jgi:hypothetical protein